MLTGVRRERKLMARLSVLCVVSILLCASSAVAERPSVVTTVFPLTEFARAVGGKAVEVRQLLPPGAEAHTWDPTPSDIVALAKADVCICIGATMEPWVPGVLRSLGTKRPELIEATKGAALIEGNEGTPDPHVWLDFEYDQRIIDEIVTMFSHLAPESAPEFARNGDEYKSRLQALDRTYANTLKGCKRKEVVLGSHAAFGYLARRYGLDQVAVYGLSPNAEPTPRKMAEIITLSKRLGVKAVYFEELVSDKLAKAIAEEAGAKTLVLNPGPNLTQRQMAEQVTFIDLMERNLENLKEGLGCE